jgi:hypothetical protein
MLMLGRQVRIPAELSRNIYDDGKSATSYGECAENLRQRMYVTHQLARQNLGKASLQNKYSYDVKLSENKYKIGDCAWYFHESRFLGVCSKLRKLYKLCVITKRVNSLNYMIKIQDSEMRTVHHDKLKPYYGDKVPKWVIKVRNKLKELVKVKVWIKLFLLLHVC